jgi:riboflavin synthase
MFTGIISEVGRVTSQRNGKLVVEAANIIKGLELGGSVAVNGACLTVTTFDSSSFSVDIAPETVRRTNIGGLKTGDPVNLERPLGLGGELGGHLVQGHVDDTGKLVDTDPEGGATLLRFQAKPEIMQYIVEKGFIAIEGISLTITDRGSGDFQVSVVDYTKNHTNLKYHKIGDLVNLEVDIMAKYVQRFIQSQRPQITLERLRENGF